MRHVGIEAESAKVWRRLGPREFAWGAVQSSVFKVRGFDHWKKSAKRRRRKMKNEEQ
jgi:hypothetical protein